MTRKLTVKKYNSLLKASIANNCQAIIKRIIDYFYHIHQDNVHKCVSINLLGVISVVRLCLVTDNWHCYRKTCICVYVCFIDLSDRQLALFRVFSYLDSSTLCIAGAVCREWYHISRLPDLWTSVVLKQQHISDKVRINLVIKY